MTILKVNYRDYRHYLGEVVGMWAKVHGLSLNLLWTASPFLTILGIVGIFSTSGNLQTASFSVTGFFGFILVFSLLLVAPYKVWKRDTDKLNVRIDELIPLEKYKQEQEGHEEDWLHLVVQRIDLGKGLNSPENQIVVKFNFDSGLIYEIKPHRISLTPILGGYEPPEPQYEMEQTPNFPRGKRSQESSKSIIIKDDKLMEMVNSARQGNKVSKALEVAMQLEPNKPIHYFRAELP